MKRTAPEDELRVTAGSRSRSHNARTRDDDTRYHCRPTRHDGRPCDRSPGWRMMFVVTMLLGDREGRHREQEDGDKKRA
jgi:hypothetical protein